MWMTSQVFIDGDFHKSVMSSACTKVSVSLFKLFITASCWSLEQLMHCMFCFSFYSVLWRMSIWVSRSISVCKHWDLTVWVQRAWTPHTGPQPGQTSTDWLRHLTLWFRWSKASNVWWILIPHFHSVRFTDFTSIFLSVTTTQRKPSWPGRGVNGKFWAFPCTFVSEQCVALQLLWYS